MVAMYFQWCQKCVSLLKSYEVEDVPLVHCWNSVWSKSENLLGALGNH